MQPDSLHVCASEYRWEVGFTMSAAAPDSVPAIFEVGAFVEAKHPKNKKWRRGVILEWCATEEKYKMYFRGLPKDDYFVKKAHVRPDKLAVKKEEAKVAQPVPIVDLTEEALDDDVICVDKKELVQRPTFGDYNPELPVPPYYEDQFDNAGYTYNDCYDDYYHGYDYGYSQPYPHEEKKIEEPPVAPRPLTEAEKRAKDEEMEAAMRDSHPVGFMEELKKRKEFLKNRRELFENQRIKRLSRQNRIGFMSVGNDLQASKDRAREYRKAQERRRAEEEEKKKKRKQKRIQWQKRVEEEIQPAFVPVLSDTESDSSTDAPISSPEAANGAAPKEARPRTSASAGTSTTLSSRKRFATNRDPAPATKRVELPKPAEVVEVVDYESLAKNRTEARLNEAITTRELRKIRKRTKSVTLVESSDAELPQPANEPRVWTSPSDDDEEGPPSKCSEVPRFGRTLMDAAEEFRGKVQDRIRKLRQDKEDKVEMVEGDEKEKRRKYNLRPRGLSNRVEQVNDGIDYWKVHLDVWLGELLHIHNGQIDDTPTSNSNSNLTAEIHVSTSRRKSTSRKNAGSRVVRMWKELERFTAERFNSLRSLVLDRHAPPAPPVTGNEHCACTCNSNDNVQAPWVRFSCVECKGYVHAWCAGIRDTARWNRVLCVRCVENGHAGSIGLKAALPSITNPLISQCIRRIPHKKDEVEAARRRVIARAKAARVDLPLDDRDIKGMCENLELLRIGVAPSNSFRCGVVDRLVSGKLGNP